MKLNGDGRVIWEEDEEPGEEGEEPEEERAEQEEEGEEEQLPQKPTLAPIFKPTDPKQQVAGWKRQKPSLPASLSGHLTKW